MDADSEAAVSCVVWCCEMLRVRTGCLPGDVRDVGRQAEQRTSPAPL